ncbi:MAG: UPF0158 family protein [Candidatus Latescibacterota bacterium]
MKGSASGRSREHALLLLRKAAEDEYVLDCLLEDPDSPTAPFGFHAQQAAEKLLKAALVCSGITYPRTHRLAELTDLLLQAGVTAVEAYDGLRVLTPFAVELRYDVLPDEEGDTPLARDEVRALLRQLRAWVESLLAPEQAPQAPPADAGTSLPGVVPLRRLPIDLSELALAMEGFGDELSSHHFLDLRTGEIWLLDEDLLQSVADEDLGDLADWEEDLVPIARAVHEGDPALVAVPRLESHEAFGIMEDFVAQLADDRVHYRLAEALRGPRPFRRFRDAIHGLPDLRDRWHAFDEARRQEAARRWLAELGVEPGEG